jgi:ATP-binding cassette subfamily B protein/ATP-binding cassette subfamily C protein LapB
MSLSPPRTHGPDAGRVADPATAATADVAAPVVEAAASAESAAIGETPTPADRVTPATPHRLHTVLKVAIGRMVPGDAPALPDWADELASPAQARRLARWLRRRCDLQLADAGSSLLGALGSSAQLVLARCTEGWYLIDCRQGAATLWSGVGEAPVPLSSIDAVRVERLLSLRPAQDLAPRTATSPERQPLVLPFLREHRGRLIELTLAGLVINGIGMLLPLFSMLVYDRIIGNGILETLWAIAIGLGLFVLLELFLKAGRTHAVESVTCRLDARVDRRLLERLLAQRGPMPPVGVMLARYRDLVASRDFLSSSWLMALVDVPFAALYLLVIGLIAGPLVWVPLVIAVVMVAVQWLLHRPAVRYGEIATRAQTGKVNTLAETLGAGEVVRATPLRWTLSRRFGQLAEQAALAQARGRYWSSLGAHFTGTCVTLSWMGVLVAGVYLIEARLLTVGGLVACSMLTSRAIGMLAGLAALAARWSELRRASRLMDELVADTDAPPPIDAGSAQWMSRVSALSLRELGFDHDPARPLFDGLNLEVPPGELVVLIGRPGAGKTTLLKLLGGLLRPSRGDAMLDGHSVLDWPLEFRARHIGFKPQEAVLFEGTLAENILGGAEAYVDATRFAEALAVSGLDQWIARGTLSLSQRVLPGGSNLSGGQRQVVALARAIVGGCPVLLLDEPTVGLDQATEAGIVARLRAWGRGRTIVVATHSMAMVNAADRIVLIEGGRIVANGPRDKVLAPGAAVGGAPASASAVPHGTPPPAPSRGAAAAAVPASSRGVPAATVAASVPAPSRSPSAAPAAMPALGVPAGAHVASAQAAAATGEAPAASGSRGTPPPALAADPRAPSPPATPTPIAPFGRTPAPIPLAPAAGARAPVGRDLSSMLRRYASASRAPQAGAREPARAPGGPDTPSVPSRAAAATPTSPGPVPATEPGEQVREEAAEAAAAEASDCATPAARTPAPARACDEAPAEAPPRA